MAERRKIIIEMDARPDGPLPSPHFDAEATLTARPVVPLSEQETFHMHYAPQGAANAAPFWKRPALVALILLAAVGLGVAAGLGIGYFRNRKSAETPVANSPAAPVESANTSQPTGPAETVLSPESSASIPEKPAEIPAQAKDDELERASRERDDKAEVTPPAIKEKKRDEADYDEESADERAAERQRRREERRERRRRERDEAIDIPRQIERAGRELDRIREIFEGKQP